MAEQLSLDEIVQRTNAPLAEVRAARRRVEELACERPAPSAEHAATELMLPGTPLREVPAFVQDVELRETLGRLQPYEGNVPEVAAFLQALQGWRSLDSGGRSALLQEVNTFIDDLQQSDRAIAFLNRMVRRFPQHRGWVPAIMLLPILGAIFWLVYRYGNPCLCSAM